MDVKILRHTSAGKFLEHAEAWLSQSEAENNLLLGVARRYQNDCSDGESPTYWASIHSDKSLVGCAFRTPPHPLGLTAMPPEAIPALVDDVESLYSALPGVNGPAREAEQFARCWAERGKLNTRVHTRLRIHELTQVTFPHRAAQGALREPLDSERLLAKNWICQFATDVGMGGDAATEADEWIASGRVFVWDDDGPRCLVAAARESTNGVCINAVFTPPSFRRRGYASIAVATVSQRMLSNGKSFCCLYTDLENPTSNSIYRRIGYKPIRDDVHLEFVS